MIVALNNALFGKLIMAHDLQQPGGYGFVKGVLWHRTELVALLRRAIELAPGVIFIRTKRRQSTRRTGGRQPADEQATGKS